MSDHDYNPPHKPALDSLLIGMPGVKLGKAFGHSAYKVNGKVFAFVLNTGVAIKLPAERVQELLPAHPEMNIFQVAEGIVWKEWLTIEHPDADDYVQDIGLFEESVQFVVG